MFAFSGYRHIKILAFYRHQQEKLNDSITFFFLEKKGFSFHSNCL